MTYSVDLLTDQDGAANGSAQQWPGGKGTFELDGTTFPATSVILEKLGSAGNWYTIATVLNATGFGFTNFETGPGKIRASTVGASGADVDARAVRYD